MFGKGRSVQSYSIDEMGVLARYLGISHVPFSMHSPFRSDRHRSFAFYVSSKGRIRYKDFATGDNGDLLSFMSSYLGKSRQEVIEELKSNGLCSGDSSADISDYQVITPKTVLTPRPKPVLRCRVRPWQQHDIDYWTSYGVDIDLLKKCNVFPIDYKFITVNGNTKCYPADRYAYAFAERKEGNLTFKFYQPYNSRYKWQSSHDRSVLSLWTCIPKTGDRLCICSSLKDALCLWSNMGIPCICPQGEGYGISTTAAEALKSRFANIYVCFDNDAPGINYADKFCRNTGFYNVVIPPFDGGKDISDYYKAFGKEKFIELFSNLFRQAT